MTEAQGERRWTEPGGTLGQLVKEAHARAQQLGAVGDWRARATDSARALSLSTALRGRHVAVIAEVKRRSPSRGAINVAIDPAAQAMAYVTGGAAAISVLTEPVHFGGSAADLEAVAGAVKVPVLKKDFHVAPVQMFEARARGASAALLIARAVHPDMLAELLDAARDAALEALVEVRDECELATAVALGASVIGVNNRDLETLLMDCAAANVVPLIPAAVAAVAESGIAGRREVEQAAAAGADAVLVGSMLSAAADPRAAVAELVGVQVTRERRPR